MLLFCLYQWDVPGLGNYRTVKPQIVNTGAVIGAGTMGTGIAMTMLNAGMSVILIEQDEKVFTICYYFSLISFIRQTCFYLVSNYVSCR